MTNVASPLNGQGNKLPLYLLPDGSAGLPALGDDLGALPGNDTHAGPFLTQGVKAATADRSSLASTATADSGTGANLLLAANDLRKGVIIQNDSTASLYVGFGTAHVSATDYTIKVPAGAAYVLDFSFSGELHGIWSAADGFAYVTELT